MTEPGPDDIRWYTHGEGRRAWDRLKVENDTLKAENDALKTAFFTTGFTIEMVEAACGLGASLARFDNALSAYKAQAS